MTDLKKNGNGYHRNGKSDPDEDTQERKKIK